MTFGSLADILQPRMSPLEIEEYYPYKRQWSPPKILEPGRSERRQSVQPDGTIFTYRFSCALDNSHSLIERSVGGIVAVGGTKIIASARWETVTRLEEGRSFSLILNESIGIGQRLRLTHR